MRAIALAIVLAGLGIEYAIRQKNMEWSVVVFGTAAFVGFIVCVVEGW